MKISIPENECHDYKHATDFILDVSGSLEIVLRLYLGII